MQKVVQGQVTAIEPRANDWAAVHILVPGKQFPIKLSTKRQDLIGAAQQMAWQVVDALYNEEESTNINPHNGQPYVNRYLEQLAPAGQMPQPQQNPTQPAVPMPIPAQPQAVPTTGMQPQQQGFGNLQPQQQMPPQPVVQNPPFPPQPQGTVRHEVVTDDARETRIMRQAATKVAAAFLPSLAEEDQNLGSLIRISEQLLKYYREGVSWETNPVAFDGEGHDAQAQAEHQAMLAADPGPQPDDDAFPQGY